MKVSKYRRREGYRVTFVRKTWRGKYQTLFVERVSTGEDVLRLIDSVVILPPETREKVEEFCLRDE